MSQAPQHTRSEAPPSSTLSNQPVQNAARAQRPITGKALTDNSFTCACLCALAALICLLFSQIGTRAACPTQFDFHDIALRLMPPTQQDPDAAAQRVINYLLRAEFREVDAWQQDDYRVSRMTVAHAAAGHPNAWQFAFWSYYGKTLPAALEAWAERDRATAAMLERVAGQVRAATLPPKKPARPAMRFYTRKGGAA